MYILNDLPIGLLIIANLAQRARLAMRSNCIFGVVCLTTWPELLRGCRMQFGDTADTNLCYAGLSEQFGYQLAVDIGQAEVAALEAKRELFVVEAEEVKDGGVQIVDVDAVGNRIEA